MRVDEIKMTLFGLDGSYSGEMQHNEANGIGKFSCEKDINGKKIFTLIVGNFANGLPMGECVKKTFENQIIVANFINGYACGNGKIYSYKGIYEGELLNDLPHGNGEYFCCENIEEKFDLHDDYKKLLTKETEAKNFRLSGVWQNGQMVNGKLSDFDNKISYEGQFSQGVFSGYGKYSDLDCDYEGNFKNGKFDGIGAKHYEMVRTIVWEEGEYKANSFVCGQQWKAKTNKLEYYNGQFVNNEKNGQGEYKVYKIDAKITTLAQAKEIVEKDEFVKAFKGKFKANVPWGKGELTEKGETHLVIFENGKLLTRCDCEKKVLNLPNGKYEGDVVDDKPNGKGKMLYTNGDKYEGEFKNGLRHGTDGTLKLADGTIYSGHWQEDEFTGKGFIRTNFGVNITLIGDESRFVNGKIEGKCRIYNNSNCKCVVGIKNGLLNGEAKISFDNVKKPVVDLIADKMIQPSIYDLMSKSKDKYFVNFKGRFENGFLIKGEVSANSFYNGDFANGLYEGNGVLYQDQKFRYQGEFKAGEFNGHGRYVHQSPFYDFEGIFENGKPVKGIMYRHIDHYEKYEGEVKGFRKHGLGKCYYSDRYNEFDENWFYEGEFKNNKRNGKGTLYAPDGKVYIGEWFDDRFTGNGKVIDSDGHITEGVWDKGELVKSK